jgi:hypothetical protein
VTRAVGYAARVLFIYRGCPVPKSRSELIYLAYEMTRKRLIKQGTDPLVAALRAEIHVARLYNLKSFLDVKPHLRAARRAK